MTELRVLITGGGRGIGRAIALRFAREGAKVAIAARTSSELDSVVAEINKAGGQGCPLQMDVTEHGSVEGAVYRALQFTGGTLDVLVNNAGAFEVKNFEQMNLPVWHKMIDVNLTGAFYVTLETLDGLLESDKPHVFNVASVAARQGFPGNTAYCAAKYGLRGFSDGLRVDLAPKKVRVSTVYPGPTDTKMLEALAGFDRSKALKPEAVAEVVWNAYASPLGTPVDDLDVPAR